MKNPIRFAEFIETACGTDPAGRDLAIVFHKLAETFKTISRMVARGPLEGDLAASSGRNPDGDDQKALDILANDIVIEALRDAPVAYLLSEELEDPVELKPQAGLLVAIDPLDGSSNIETNAPVGTIVSLLRNIDAPSAADRFLQRGRDQLAAAYCVYGAQTVLMLTVGNGTHAFTLDPTDQAFYLTNEAAQISTATREIAINAANVRHWDRRVRRYYEDCILGDSGMPKQDYNMRWIASLVAECHRIIARGGVFLYPADARKGYHNGRLRLLYECNPVALIVEQAGGAATDGEEPILDAVPQSLHQRSPMIFGSAREVSLIGHYFEERTMTAASSLLFEPRGLLRS